MTIAATAGTVTGTPRTRLGAYVRRNRFALACVAPTIIVLFLVTIFPTFYAIYISLFDFYLPKPRLTSFVGFDNYIDVLSDARFWDAIWYTAVFMVGAIGVEFVLGFALAMFFFEEFRGRSVKAIYLPLILLPMMVAPVVVGYMWRLLYQVEFGPINYLLRTFVGIGPFEWTSSPDTALMSVIIADVWQWTPFVTLVLLAGMVSLPLEMFENAEMDGANVAQRLRYVIVPLMRRVIAIVLLIRVLDAFRELDKIFVMTQGGPGTATEVTSYYAYLNGFKYLKIGYASAMALLLMIITVLLCQMIAKLMHREEPGT